MVRTINGIPGSGKNVIATHIAKKHFKKMNSPLRRAIRRIAHRPVWINNVYTTYPVLLRRGTKKRKATYSMRVSLFDLVPQNKFLPHAKIIIDETQVVFDSEEFKEFPKDIATFNQFHRHFGIDDIIYITQHPSRLLKKLRVLCSEYDRVKTFILIPIIKLAIINVVQYYEFEDYGKYNHPKKEAKTYDVANKLYIFFARKVFNSYDSTYMRVLNENSPLFDRGEFDDMVLSSAEISYVFKDRI